MYKVHLFILGEIVSFFVGSNKEGFTFHCNNESLGIKIETTIRRSMIEAVNSIKCNKINDNIDNDILFKLYDDMFRDYILNFSMRNIFTNFLLYNKYDPDIIIPEHMLVDGKVNKCVIDFLIKHDIDNILELK